MFRFCLLLYSGWAECCWWEVTDVARGRCLRGRLMDVVTGRRVESDLQRYFRYRDCSVVRDVSCYGFAWVICKILTSSFQGNRLSRHL
jgi:hypothetical protein